MSSSVVNLLQAVPNVESVDLGDCGITTENATTLATQLEKMPNLRTLKLAANRELGAGVATIISNSVTLENLDISSCGLKPKHAEAVAAQLGKMSNLRSLKLASNHDFGDNVVKLLGAVPNVASVDLGNCGILPQYAEAIAERLANMPNLRTLELYDNDELGSSVVNLLQAVPKLESVDLGDCGILREHAQELAWTLGNMAGLRTLKLAANRKLGAGVATIIGNSVTLENLDISSCGLKPEHVEALATQLGKMSKLRTLKLYGNYDLGQKVAAIASAILKSEARIEILNIRHCGIPGDLMTKLIADFEDLTSLRNLTLSEVAPMSNQSHQETSPATTETNQKDVTSTPASAPENEDRVNTLTPEAVIPPKAASPVKSQALPKQPAALGRSIYGSTAIGLVLALGAATLIAAVVYPEETRKFFTDNFDKLSDLLNQAQEKISSVFVR